MRIDHFKGQHVHHLVAAGLALLIGACSSSSGIHPDDREGSYPLWKVEGTSNTVWLLGSVHLLPKTSYPLPAAFDRAYQNSEVSVFEIDMSNMGPMEVMGLLGSAMLPPGTTLSDRLSEETLSMLEPRLDEVMSGLAGQLGDLSGDGEGLGGMMPGGVDDGMLREMLYRMEPWFLGFLVQSGEATAGAKDLVAGVDMHYTEMSKEDEKDLLGLESFSDQLGFFKAIAGDDPDAYLQSILMNKDTATGDFTTIVDAWESGDLTKLDAIVNGTLRDSPEFYQKLLVDRNENWMPRIERFLRSDKNHFVVVGAAHLVGKDGVVAMLRNKGYRVIRQ